MPVYQGVAFLGKLANKVEQYTTASDPNQVKRAIEYMQLYVILAVLRTSILWEMYALIKAVPKSGLYPFKNILQQLPFHESSIKKMKMTKLSSKKFC